MSISLGAAPVQAAAPSGRMLRREGRVAVLVSARDPAEVRLVAAAGVDLVDLKEPRGGALGGLEIATIRACMAALRDEPSRPSLRVSATIGDQHGSSFDAIARADYSQPEGHERSVSPPPAPPLPREGGLFRRFLGGFRFRD